MSSILSIIIISIGLSMDSFAVSVSNGISFQKLSISKMIIIASSLAFSQAAMPLLGWLSGNILVDYIRGIDHWIAFILLSFIGGKMIYESLTKEDLKSKAETLSFPMLIQQSIATSIDAFAVGISFALLDVEIIESILIIGIITFIFSITGLYIGKSIGERLKSKSEIFGGIILIGIGSKILIEHLFFN